MTKYNVTTVDMKSFHTSIKIVKGFCDISFSTSSDTANSNIQLKTIELKNRYVMREKIKRGTLGTTLE